MRKKPKWPPLTEPEQLRLPLPIPKGVKRFCDACPRCRCTHASQQDAEDCRKLASQREQL